MNTAPFVYDPASGTLGASPDFGDKAFQRLESPVTWTSVSSRSLDIQAWRAWGAALLSVARLPWLPRRGGYYMRLYRSAGLDLSQSPWDKADEVWR